MNLSQVQYELTCLAKWLIEHRELEPMFKHIHFKWAREQDDRNKKDPRSFCYVTSGTLVIYASLALADLPQVNRFGVMLHEIGHLHLRAFNGDESEVDVDEWCTFKVPESGYVYTDAEYLCPWTKSFVIAKNLETVRYGFVSQVME